MQLLLLRVERTGIQATLPDQGGAGRRARAVPEGPQGRGSGGRGEAPRPEAQEVADRETRRFFLARAYFPVGWSFSRKRKARAWPASISSARSSASFAFVTSSRLRCTFASQNHVSAERG